MNPRSQGDQGSRHGAQAVDLGGGAAAR